MASRLGRKWDELWSRWENDLMTFCREGLNYTPTWQQEQLLRTIEWDVCAPESLRKKRVAVASGQGPGKGKSTSAAMAWLLLRNKGTWCIVTAPNMRQCEQWISEFGRTMAAAHPLLRKFVKVYGTKIQVKGFKDWKITTATASRSEAFQGMHEKNMVILADECSGVDRSIIETIKGTLTNPNSLFIATGNPNTTDCAFYDFFTKEQDAWHTMMWNTEDTARDYPWLVDPSNIEKLAEEFGKDSDPYRVRVLGMFPKEAPNCIVGIEDLVACTKTSLVGCSQIERILPHMNAMGIDFARFGFDENVVFVRRGLAILEWRKFAKCEPADVVDWAFEAQLRYGWENNQVWYVPDAVGIGEGLMASFHRAGKRFHEFRSNGRSSRPKKFKNQISEAWWTFGQLAKKHIVHIPNDSRLLQQLSTRQYKAPGGIIEVESKDKWKERLEISESPDRADALVQAFFCGFSGKGRVSSPLSAGR